MDGDAADLPVDLVALPGMDTRPDIEAKLLDGRRDRDRATQSLRGSVNVAKNPSPVVSCS